MVLVKGEWFDLYDVKLKRGFCNSENQIGSELLQVSEVSHKSWKFTIRVIIKRLR